MLGLISGCHHEKTQIFLTQGEDTASLVLSLDTSLMQQPSTDWFSACIYLGENYYKEHRCPYGPTVVEWEAHLAFLSKGIFPSPLGPWETPTQNYCPALACWMINKVFCELLAIRFRAILRYFRFTSCPISTVCFQKMWVKFLHPYLETTPKPLKNIWNCQQNLLRIEFWVVVTHSGHHKGKFISPWFLSLFFREKTEALYLQTRLILNQSNVNCKVF